MTSLPVERSRRRLLGAWYTPSDLSEPIASWAIRSSSDRVLDPAVGDGAFLLAAARARRGASLDLVGFDVNPVAVAETRGRLRGASVAEADVQTEDFLAVDSPQGLFGGRLFDAVVGNPPYVRFQLLGAFADRARSRAEESGVRLSRLASSWAVFVVHGASFLKPEGRLAFVLPEELAHVGYAEPVRRFLRERFATTTVVAFEDRVFPSTQERVVVLLAEGRPTGARGELRLVRVRDLDAFAAAAARGFPDAETYADDVEPRRWEAGDLDEGAEVLEGLVSKGDFIPLRRAGTAGIGYVSGANEFFILDSESAAARRLPRPSLRPTLVDARMTPGAIVDEADLRRWREESVPHLLWTGRGPSSKAADAYRLEGERRGVHLRYKCRVREPWFVVPGVKTPDAFLTYMSDAAPRLALNRLGAACANNLHAVTLEGVDVDRRPAFVAAFHSSATALAAERTGRRYGGGVLKLEPSEATALAVPAPDVVRRLKRGGELLVGVDRALRSGSAESAFDLVDSALLRETLGLKPAAIAALRSSWLRRRSNRTKKKRSLSIEQ
jgi:adenine-specific DNA-methyltransferase